VCRPQPAPAIDAQLYGPTTLSHDFSTAPLCQVPVTLLLHNTAAVAAVVCVEAGRLQDGTALAACVPTWAPSAGPVASLHSNGSLLDSLGDGAAGGAVSPVRQHVWCGRTRVTLRSVAPGETAEVPLLAAVTCPGKVVLGDCHVSWHLAKQPPQLSGSRFVPPLSFAVLQQTPTLL
jgi:hypothetical protein